MKLMRFAFLTLSLTLCASAADIAGTWKAVFVGPIETRPKMVSTIVFDLNTDGTVLTGMAHAGSWPGDAAISDGRIDGDRISFTVVGTSPWKAKGPFGEASGYPKLKFSGTIVGDKMKLTLVWDSVMIYGNAHGAAPEYEMQGKRRSD